MSSSPSSIPANAFWNSINCGSCSRLYTASPLGHERVMQLDALA